MSGIKKAGFVAAGVLAMGIAAGAVKADTVVLNFDTTMGGSAIANGTLVNDAYPGLGVTFSSNAVILLGGGGVSSQPNFASGYPLYNGVITAIFDSPVSMVSATDVTNSSFTLEAFDMNDVSLGSSSASSFLQIASVSNPNIKKVVISTDSQYGIDDFTFVTGGTVHGDVPEPGTMALLTGMGVTGLMAIRRRNKK